MEQTTCSLFSLIDGMVNRETVVVDQDKEQILNRENDPKENDYWINGNNADVVAPKLSLEDMFLTL